MAPKPFYKSNSPVTKTGQGNTLKKRLLTATQNDLVKGKEKILVAARACFAKQGFASTSMKNIQVAANCSRGNLYHHFKTKEELIQNIIEQNLGRYCERIEAILNESNDRDMCLSDVIKDLASFAEEITKGPGKGMAFHVWSLAMVDADIRIIMVQYFERIRTALEKKILVLQKRGHITKTQNVQNLSVTAFGILIPGFTLQSVFMDEKALNADEYSESLHLLFQVNT